MAFNKAKRRRNIRYKIRKKIRGTDERPRLSIFRSNKYIYAQLINDLTGHTLATANSKEAAVADMDLSKIDAAKEVGKLVAARASDKGVENAVFDRSGYLYHGRVKALAEGAREGGLTI